MNKLCNAMLNPIPLSTKAIMHGRKYESVAINKLESVLNTKVKSCGLFIDKELPFLAATPDGLVGEDGIVEVKCPYKGREKNITASPEFPFLTEDENGCLALKEGHNFYAQVQGQLAITKRKTCHFAIYTFEEFHVIDIPFNEKYCSSVLLPKLYGFYNDYYRPYIAKSL